MKRSFEVVLSLFLLVILSPFFFVLALVISVTIGCPIFFQQLRAGLHGVPFFVWKFRTMTSRTDAEGKLLPDAQRLTRSGRFIREMSLDELPQLWNVLKGDMSLIGPRPLLPQYLERYTSGQRRRHEIKPGITGWAQINGRNSLSWEEKFDLDVWYVDHRSLWLDVKILWLTAQRVMHRRDISQAGHATMSEFMGSANPAEENE